MASESCANEVPCLLALGRSTAGELSRAFEKREWYFQAPLKYPGPSVCSKTEVGVESCYPPKKMLCLCSPL